MVGISLCTKMEKRYSKNGLGVVVAMVVLGGFSLLTLPAHAAHATGQHTDKQAVRDNATTVAAQDPETTGSIQSQPEPDANCAKSRMRLWVKDEGWIVRKVTTCY
jgi:hypothetical protein